MGEQGYYVRPDSLMAQARHWAEQSTTMGQIVGKIGGAQPSAVDNELSKYGFGFSTPDKFSNVIRKIGWFLAPAPTALAGLSTGDYQIFQASLSAYENARANIAGICEQGHKQLDAIQDALVQTARGYEAAEDTNTQDTKDIGY